MVRSTVFHTSDGNFLELTPVTDPQIFVIRVSSDGTAVRKEIDGSGNTIQSVSGSVFYGSTCNQFNFFKGGVPQGECEDFGSTFYWMYCSLEALTDEQILDVVQYNDGTDKTATAMTVTDVTWVTDIAGTGGTGNSWNCSYTAVVEFDDGTSETNPSGLQISGEITAATNHSHLRRDVGQLNLTFSIDELSYQTSVEAYQAGLFKNVIPYNNMYSGNTNLVSVNKGLDQFNREGNPINMMCKNGRIIYQNIETQQN